MTQARADNPLYTRAYAAMDRGDLAAAQRYFSKLIRETPQNRHYHYMYALASKYRGDWAGALTHNLRAIALAAEHDDAPYWNAGIAATALEDWAKARRLWRACGIAVPEGTGPISGNYGIAAIRLHPWAATSETVLARRIDPVRARLLGVPHPASGHRFGDIILHDSVPTGYRQHNGMEIPEYSELARLKPSPYPTYTARVRCSDDAELQPLLDDGASGDIACIEARPADGDGSITLDIAAKTRLAVAQRLCDWALAADSRSLEHISSEELPVPPPDGHPHWWLPPKNTAPLPAADSAVHAAP